ncbi:MAG TPA: beta-ketoacyl synthase N-terminal-like domain-containing protein, partial [Pseudomonadales bacterium]|nr:beta-ketoacyl synthase N-terminal-like domain-containing protein [Pseudomonadales bacterium]
MSRRRVVVTGMGMLTPLGNTVAETWAAILAGRSGIGPIETFDVTAYATQFGGGLKGFDVEQYIPQRDARRMDPFIQYGMAAGIQAF